MKTTCTEIIPIQNGIAVFDINTIYTNKEKTHLMQQFCHLPQSDTFFHLFQEKKSG